ncbi:hypothetical protein RHDE110596_07655 [Prescottella defluvii]|uniref:hypothetical protein n=1 Tax=Prescottella defluvii TaxID=1323361 RepID=UPI000B0A7FA1|nr:hypothetical protein [Prescottella defluvii]
MAVIAALLLAVGVIGTVGAIGVGGYFIGWWAQPASVAFVAIGVIGILIIGRRRP